MVTASLQVPVQATPLHPAGTPGYLGSAAFPIRFPVNPYYVLMEAADRVAAKMFLSLQLSYRRLNAVIYHKGEQLMDRARAKVWKLTKGKKKKELLYEALKSTKNPSHPLPFCTNQQKTS